MTGNNNLVVKGEPLLDPIPNVSLGEYVYNHLKNNNKQYEAMVCAETGKSVTFLNFLERTCRLAQALERAGYKKGDVISVCSENSLYFFEPVIAAMYLGITVAPINQIYSKRELMHTMDISKPCMVFCSKNTYTKFVNLLPAVKYLRKIIVFDLEEHIFGVEKYDEFVDTFSDKYFNVNNFKVAKVDPKTHVAAVLCSSGTTGLPKGVMITHENILVKLEHRKDPRFYITRKNVSTLAFLPFFHGYGFVTGFENLVIGNRMVVISRFAEELFLASIQKYRVNCLWVVPALMVFLAKSDKVLKYDLSSILELGCGAAPLSKDIESSVQKRLPNLEIFIQGYGLTEGTFALTVTPRGQGKRGASGKLLPGLEAKVRDPESNKTLGPKETGEICIKGPVLMKGYMGNEKATLETIGKDGWLLTGDLGYYDEDGYFFIVDRLKELIKYKGFQVAPVELENIILSHPKVKDVGIVGLPDDIAGELPLAFVVRQPDMEVTEQEIKVFVANQVSKPKQLHGGVRFVDAIPKNATGKIVRRELKKMLDLPIKHKL